MDCRLIRSELVAYHFGATEPRTRDAIEAHLLECRACLGGYLALKREIETAQAAPRPSAAARDRLRRAVALEVSKRPARSAAWWRGPLGFGFAAATAAAAMLAVVSVRGQLQQLAELAAQPPGIEAPAPRP